MHVLDVVLTQWQVTRYLYVCTFTVVLISLVGYLICNCVLCMIMEEKFSDLSYYTYKDAMRALSSLQSNAAYLKSVTKLNPLKSHKVDLDSHKLKDTEKYIIRSGISLEELDTLSVIHVAGTKGKGSTCAFAESILREHGYNTGFFSSPHLVTVRERIRINGLPVSQMHFTHHFWRIFERLNATKEHESDMPTYFKFLTILMFDIFLHANIDVAIVEVGIGGESDSTNIVRNPVCVGITSLGLEHTSLLGNTLEEIAYQKSGIFKPGTKAFSVPQLAEAMNVLEKRAVEKSCALRVVPPFKEYKWDKLSAISGRMSDVQKQNASLAIQLATEWMRSKARCKNGLFERTGVNIDKSNNTYQENVRINGFLPDAKMSDVTCIDKIAVALSSCKWPGRMQILRSSVADFFLDGAHTIESIECCIPWFKNVTNSTKGKKYLIFNTSGDRNSAQLLTPLKLLNFDKAYFVPNFAGVQSIDDEMNCSLLDEQIVKCQKNSETWGSSSVVANSVFEVLQDIKKNAMLENIDNNEGKVQVLVTGSLHLIGATLTILDPNLTMTTGF